jgi:hypothetical protein
MTEGFSSCCHATAYTAYDSQEAGTPTWSMNHKLTSLVVSSKPDSSNLLNRVLVISPWGQFFRLSSRWLSLILTFTLCSERVQQTACMQHA